MYPEPQAVDIPCLLGGSIRLRGYPLVAVMAEKLVTSMQRGVANTGWPDYADVLLLIREHSVDGDDLHGALTAVAAHRRSALTPLAPLLPDFPGIAQPRWARWRANPETREALKDSFHDVLAAVAHFADPASTGVARGLSWEPRTGAGDGTWPQSGHKPWPLTRRCSTRIGNCQSRLDLDTPRNTEGFRG